MLFFSVTVTCTLWINDDDDNYNNFIHFYFSSQVNCY